MSVKLLTEHRLEFVSLKGGCTGSSQSTLVRMPHCVAAKKRKNTDKYHKSSFSCKQCAVHARVHCNCFVFFMQTHEKETQLGNYVWCAKSVFVRQFPPRATQVLKQQQHMV